MVVGYGTTVKGTEAFRWTATEGLVGLGDLGVDHYSRVSPPAAAGRSTTGTCPGDDGGSE